MWSADEWGQDQGTVTSLCITPDGSLETLDTLSTGRRSVRSAFLGEQRRADVSKPSQADSGRAIPHF